jgi:hypothetical protein
MRLPSLRSTRQYGKHLVTARWRDCYAVQPPQGIGEIGVVIAEDETLEAD